MVSYLKSMYGDAATPRNDFGYDWHPRITGDHSHMPMMVDMADGKVQGHVRHRPEPGRRRPERRLAAAGAGQARLAGRARQLRDRDGLLLVQPRPRSQTARCSTADIKTEVFFLPAAQVAEMDGSFTNTQRLLQWHEKAADPPGDARSDLWFTYHLGKRLKELYAGSTLPRDQGFLNLTWNYDPEPAETLEWRIKDEPSALKILKEINGYDVADRQAPDRLRRPARTTARRPAATGSTRASSRARISNLAASRKPDNYVSLGWGFNWPANRHIMYNRASAGRTAQPWSERKKLRLVGPRVAPTEGAWVGYDVPDFTRHQGARRAGRRRTAIGLDAAVGHRPVHHEGRRQGAGCSRRPAWSTGRCRRTTSRPSRRSQNPLYPSSRAARSSSTGTRDDNQLAPVRRPEVPATSSRPIG